MTALARIYGYAPSAYSSVASWTPVRPVGTSRGALVPMASARSGRRHWRALWQQCNGARFGRQGGAEESSSAQLEPVKRLAVSGDPIEI